MQNISPKERILETAGKLFYEQGYRATGINQIIREANVAKASFYAHFPSKEELCVAYLKEMHISSHKGQREATERGGTPVERLHSLLERVERNAIKNDYKGCPFLNISSEENNPESPVREIVKVHKSRLIKLIENALEDTPNREMLAEMIYVIYEGANIAVKNYQDTWPVKRAKEAVTQMLESSG